MITSAPDYDRIPAALKTLPQFVLWRGIDRIDQQTGEVKLNKIPIDPQSLRNADTTDPTTWGTFEQCVAALPVALEEWQEEEPGSYRGGGIGFVFTTDDPFCGIDLDKCRNPITGEIATWAQRYICDLASYTEVTPSKTGLHSIVQGTLPATGRKKGQIEMYDTARFFTMTGWHLPGTPCTIESRQEALMALHQQVFPPRNSHTPPQESRPCLDDRRILDKARQAKNANKFTSLWAGDWSGYASQSEADLALCMLLAFWTQDTAQIDRLFRQSGLYREVKWSERTDYRQRTIREALARQHEHYVPVSAQPQEESVNDDFPVTTPWPELSDAALYGLVGEIVRIIAPHTEADSAAILLQFLTMFGSLVGRTPYATAEADRHYFNLFVALVGESSKGRKGVSVGYPKRLLHAIDPAWAEGRMMSGLSSGEGLIWYVRDPTYKRGKDGEECADEGERDKRLLVVEPEFARVLRVLAREGNTLSAVIRHAWDDGCLQTMVSGRRVAPVQATDAHISIVGHITMEELRRNLTETETSNGFANRFLWCCVRRSKLLPEGGMYPAEALKPLGDQLTKAVIAARKTGEMQRDEAARQRWAAVYEELSEGKPGLLGHVTARGEAQVLRLSCLYALLDQSPIVQVPHLNAALALWYYCEASATYIFADALGDTLADEIVQMLRAVSPEGMTRTEIYNTFGRNKKSVSIQQALAGLWRRQLVRCTTEATAGRPVERWYTRLASSSSTQKTQKGTTHTPDHKGQDSLNAFHTFNASPRSENDDVEEMMEWTA